MFKKTFLLTLAFILILGVFVYAEKPIPKSLEKPINLTIRPDGDLMKSRWTNPASIIQAANDVNNSDYEYYANLYYLFDWKLNDGDWNICPTPNSPTFNDDVHGYFYMDMPSIQIDDKGNSENFFVIWHFDPTKDPSDNFDFENDTYYFRMRYVMESNDNEFATIYSPYSDVSAIGKNANAIEIKKLDPPTDLKVVMKKDSNSKPYFQLDWNIPQSVTESSKHIPVFHRIDFKVGNGKWASEIEFDSMAVAGSQLLKSSDTLDPVEENYVDKVVIEENTYFFRVLFEGEPSTGTSIYSGFSNIASTKVESYSDASDWAKPELEKATEYGLIPDSLNGADMTKPITREEFAEVAIKLYEKTTGFTPDIKVSNPFIDTKNPEILKAYQIGITDGTSPTTFDPNKLINREQVATMLSRAIRIMVPAADFSIGGAPTFNDEKNISNWALEHVKYMSKIGIIKGDNGNFMPKAITSAQKAEGYANTTREQAIAMGVRTFEKYKSDADQSTSTKINTTSNKIDANSKGFMFVLEFALGAPFTESQERLILDELKDSWSMYTEDELSEYDQYPLLVKQILAMDQNALNELKVALEEAIIDWLENSPDTDIVVNIINEQLNKQGKVVIAGATPLTEMSLTAYSEIIAYSRLLKESPNAMPDQISLDSVNKIKNQVKDSWNNFTIEEKEQINSSPGLWMCLRTLANNGSTDEQSMVRSNLLELTPDVTQPTEGGGTGDTQNKPMSMAAHNVMMNVQQMTFNNYRWCRGFY